MTKKIAAYMLYILFLMVVFWGALSYELYKTMQFEVTSYTVEPGDTYDILANKLGGSDDLSSYRERVKMLNGRTDSFLYRGETIYVYVREGK